MFVIKVIDKILNKIKEFYLMRVCIKFGGNLMGIWVGFWVEGIERIFVSGVSTHMNEGRARGQPPCAGHPLGVPPPPIKGTPLLTSHSHLVKDLSAPLEFIPQGLGLARYMFPVAIRQERVVLPLHRWSEEAEVAQCLVHVCEHGCCHIPRFSKSCNVKNNWVK